MKNFKGILFDFDGVLADTMQDNFLAWKNSFLEFGVEIKESDYFLLEGMKVVEIARILSRRYNLNVNPRDIVRLKNKYYLENHFFSFYDEIPELIGFLKNRGKKLAIVSASPKEKLEKTVSEDFLGRFDAVISGDDTKKGKPDPEPYLVAVKKLCLKNSDCIVVENAPLGVKSAKRAGCFCVALATTLDKEYLRKADLVLNDHKELKSLFHHI